MLSPLIESIELTEFRGIRGCKNPIELSRFSVLIGRNNSGKTTILEALSMLPVDRIRTKRFPPADWTIVDYMDYLHGGLDSLIYCYVGKAIINCVVHGERITWEYSGGESASIASLTKGPLTAEELAKLLGFKHYGQALTSILLLPNDTRFLKELTHSLSSKKEWVKVEKSGANTSVVELIDKVVHDSFTEATVRFNTIVLRKELPDGHVIYVNASDLGDGVERVLIYGLWLETYRPKVVLWDDIEASAHPGLIESVLEWLASKDWQVVLTTHSYDVLERLIAVEPEDASIIVLKKDANDILESKVLSLDELSDMLESHMDIRRVVDIL